MVVALGVCNALQDVSFGSQGGRLLQKGQIMVDAEKVLHSTNLFRERRMIGSDQTKGVGKVFGTLSPGVEPDIRSIPMGSYHGSPASAIKTFQATPHSVVIDLSPLKLARVFFDSE